MFTQSHALDSTESLTDSQRAPSTAAAVLVAALPVALLVALTAPQFAAGVVVTALAVAGYGWLS